VSVLAQLSRDLAALVARAAPSVVGLGHRRGQGSGMVLAADGYILTNSHVARSPGALSVRLSDGVTLPGDLFARLDEEAIGRSVTLRLLRAGEVKDVVAQVGTRDARTS